MIQTMLGINIVYNKIRNFFSDDLYEMFSDLVSNISGKFGQKRVEMGQIQNLRFCDGRNSADIFSCPEFPVVRLDTMSGFSE